MLDTPNKTAPRTSAPSSEEAIAEGRLLGGKYRVVSRLGSGGMGTVYRVLQVLLNKEFALKTLEGRGVTEVSLRRFQLEAKAASSFSHPNVVQVHDIGLLEDGRPFLVMDLIKGITLAAYIKQNGPLPVEMVAPVFAQVCFGLLAAHDHGIVHRDIKPGNIMLVDGLPTNTEGSVKVLDFGIAKLSGSEMGGVQTLTTTGELVGSPLYMSPEQCSTGSVDHRSDVYSLGCVLFEALTGAPPHLGPTALATMQMHQTSRCPTLKEASLGKEFPESLEKIVGRMLRKSPAERYQNLGLVAHDLASVCRDGKSAELWASASNHKKPARMISLPAWQLYSLVALSVGFSAVLSSAGTYFLGHNQAPNVVAPATTGKPADEKSHTKIDDAEEGLLTDVNSIRMDGSRSRLITSVMQSDGKRNITLPDTSLGTLWETSYGMRFRPLSSAKGTVAIPVNSEIMLELRKPTSQDARQLEKIDSRTINGLALNYSTKADSVDSATSRRIVLLRMLKTVMTWPHLNALYLKNCPIDAEIVKALNDLQKLCYLEVEDTASPQNKARPNQNQSSQNQSLEEALNAAPLSDQAFLHRLERLVLHELPANAIVSRLAGSESLKHLILLNTPLSSECIEKLRQCPNLCLLMLANKTIDDRTAKTISQLKNLQRVYLISLSSTQLKMLENTNGIKEIFLDAKSYSAAERKSLLAKNAKIRFENP